MKTCPCLALSLTIKARPIRGLVRYTREWYDLTSWTRRGAMASEGALSGGVVRVGELVKPRPLTAPFRSKDKATGTLYVLGGKQNVSPWRRERENRTMSQVIRTGNPQRWSGAKAAFCLAMKVHTSSPQKRDMPSLLNS